MSFEQDFRYERYQRMCNTSMRENDLEHEVSEFQKKIGVKPIPWREVDNRKAYMEKRMRMEGLE
jgi:hypothetical protein